MLFSSAIVGFPLHRSWVEICRNIIKQITLYFYEVYIQFFLHFISFSLSYLTTRFKIQLSVKIPINFLLWNTKTYVILYAFLSNGTLNPCIRGFLERDMILGIFWFRIGDNSYRENYENIAYVFELEVRYDMSFLKNLVFYFAIP